MHVKSIEPGSLIWTQDELDVWVLARVLRQEKTLLTVSVQKTGEEREIDLVRD